VDIVDVYPKNVHLCVSNNQEENGRVIEEYYCEIFLEKDFVPEYKK
jgi:hypothetical protein